MRRFAFAVALAVLVAWVAPPRAGAEPWSLEDLNKTITATNFIVESGCSGTLISVRLRLILTNFHCVADKISAVEREEPQPAGTVRKVRREQLDVAARPLEVEEPDVEEDLPLLLRDRRHRPLRQVRTVGVVEPALPRHLVEAERPFRVGSDRLDTTAGNHGRDRVGGHVDAEHLAVDSAPARVVVVDQV
mgnify:CR=1 FL=1